MGLNRPGALDRVTLGRSTGAPFTYTKTFAGAENPLRDTWHWEHQDALLTDVKVELLGGVYVAHGTQVGGPFAPYDDSNVYLRGFGIDHYIEATVWRDPAIASTPNMEIELLLRWSDDNDVRSTAYGDTHADGYEININQNGDYFQVGRFKGALLQSAFAGIPVPATGDLFQAQIQTITATSVQIKCWWNGTLHIDYTDSAAPPLRGNPGIGFYRSAGGPNDKLGFSAVTARDL